MGQRKDKFPVPVSPRCNSVQAGVVLLTMERQMVDFEVVRFNRRRQRLPNSTLLFPLLLSTTVRLCYKQLQVHRQESYLLPSLLLSVPSRCYKNTQKKPNLHTRAHARTHTIKLWM